MADYLYKALHNTLLPVMTAIAITATVTLQSCSDDEHFDELPGEIQKFMALYYPEIAVASYSFNNGTYSVVLRNSATMTFNSSYQWISVNGRGSVLPEIFLYDCLPDALYEYIQTTSNTTNIYAASHNATTYTLNLLDAVISYDIGTSSVSYESSPGRI